MWSAIDLLKRLVNYFVNNSIERIICSIFSTGKFEFKYNAIEKFSEEKLFRNCLEFYAFVVSANL